MAYAVATIGGRPMSIVITRTEEEEGEATTTGAATEEETHSETTVEEPSPLSVETDELAWGLGSFLVLLALMRFLLYPRVAKGMKARADHIAQTLAAADKTRADAKSDVSSYDARLAEIRTEAAATVDAARAKVESERADAVAAANKRIAARRAEATASADAARASVSGSIAEAAGDVVSAATRAVLGKVPDSGSVSSAVNKAMGSN